MTLILGMAVLTAVAMAVIWLPPFVADHRHPHMAAMDALADPIRLHDCGRFHRDSERCPAVERCLCGAPTDAIGGCLGRCAGEEWEWDG